MSTATGRPPRRPATPSRNRARSSSSSCRPCRSGFKVLKAANLAAAVTRFFAPGFPSIPDKHMRSIERSIHTIKQKSGTAEFACLDEPGMPQQMQMGAAVRGLEAFLEEADPGNKYPGGLTRVVLDDGHSVLYVCNRCLDPGKRRQATAARQPKAQQPRPSGQALGGGGQRNKRPSVRPSRPKKKLTNHTDSDTETETETEEDTEEGGEDEENDGDEGTQDQHDHQEDEEMTPQDDDQGAAEQEAHLETGEDPSLPSLPGKATQGAGMLSKAAGFLLGLFGKGRRQPGAKTSHIAWASPNVSKKNKTSKDRAHLLDPRSLETSK